MKRNSFRLLTTLVLVATLIALVAPSALAKKPQPNPPAPEPPRNANVSFRGVIESKNGSWVVSGITVQVTERTNVLEQAGPADVGAEVMVQGVQQADRSVMARVIRVLKPKTQPKTPVQFTAPIVALPAEGVIGEWTVGTETVIVSEDTTLQPAGVIPQLQDIAHVIGIRNEEGNVEARLIQVRNPSLKEVEFVGPIQSFSDTEWMVRNIRVIVNGDTEIEGTPVVGYVAEVEGIQQPDGSVIASHIKVREPQVEVEPVDFQGIIVSKSGDEPPSTWVVRPLFALEAYPTLIEISVTEDTAIDERKGPADVGALVVVVALPMPTEEASITDVTLVAKRIKVLRPPVNEEITFAGPIDQIEPTTWVVRGVKVLIDETTVIEGLEPEVGLMAVVTGILRTTKVVEATHIEVKEALPDELEFDGVINEKTETLPGEWLFAPDGPLTVIYHIWVTEMTHINEDAGPADVGAHVHVEAHRSVSGNLVANSIEVLPEETP